MKFTNVSGEHRDLPTLGLFGLAPGAEFDVADIGDARNLHASPDFELAQGEELPPDPNDDPTPTGAATPGDPPGDPQSPDPARTDKPAAKTTKEKSA